MEQAIISALADNYNTLAIDGNARKISNIVRRNLQNIVLKSSKPLFAMRSKPLVVVVYFVNGYIAATGSGRKRRKKRKTVDTVQKANVIYQEDRARKLSDEYPFLPVVQNTNSVDPEYRVRKLSDELPFLPVVQSMGSNEYSALPAAQNDEPYNADVFIPHSPPSCNEDSSKPNPDVHIPHGNTEESSVDGHDLFQQLDINIIANKLPTTTVIDGLQENSFVEDNKDNKMQDEIYEEDIAEPEYISNIRKKNEEIMAHCEKIIHDFSDKINKVTRQLEQLQQSFEKAIKHRDNTRQALETRLQDELSKWKRNKRRQYGKKVKRIAESKHK